MNQFLGVEYHIHSPYDRPRLIETLQGKGVTEIACGGAHSAAITSSGELYTWGKGRYGRLGHGDSEVILGLCPVDSMMSFLILIIIFWHQVIYAMKVQVIVYA